MIGHHPDETLLLAYASGGIDEARALIVAVHMAYCAPCRGSVAMMEKMGGALLEQLAPAPLETEALNRALTRLETAAPFERPRRKVSQAVSARPQDFTPQVLRDYLGGDLQDVRWRPMGLNLSHAPVFRRGDVKVRLLRGRPGADPGAHSHRGLEYTLVLRGGYTDSTGNYGPGDLQVMADTVLHSPVADPGEDCVTLAVTTAPLRFKGLLQKIVAPIFGF